MSEKPQPSMGEQLKGFGQSAVEGGKAQIVGAAEGAKDWAQGKAENFVGKIQEARESVTERVNKTKEFVESIKAAVSEKGGALQGKLQELPSKIKEFSENALLKTIGALTPEGRQLIMDKGQEKVKEIQEKAQAKIEAVIGKFQEKMESIRSNIENSARSFIKQRGERFLNWLNPGENSEGSEKTKEFQEKYKELLDNADFTTPEGIMGLIESLQKLRAEMEEYANEKEDTDKDAEPTPIFGAAQQEASNEVADQAEKETKEQIKELERQMQELSRLMDQARAQMQLVQQKLQQLKEQEEKPAQAA